MAEEDNLFSRLFRERFGRPPTPEEVQLIVDQSVTSINQTGGITAHTIHMKPPQRTMGDEWRREVIQELAKWPKTESFQIMVPNGNGEAYRFAQAILKYMLAEGYNVSDCIGAVSSANPGQGLRVGRMKLFGGGELPGVKVNVGEHPNA